MVFNDSLVTQKNPNVIDAGAPVFEKVQVALFDLFRASMEVTKTSILENRTFRGCHIEGPAVMLVLPGTRFERTNFGPNNGDIRTLLLKPMNSRQVIGAIPVRGCTFEDCTFYAMGFTGHDDFLETMIQGLGGPAPTGNA
jgi:hypothetical protein